MRVRVRFFGEDTRGLVKFTHVRPFAEKPDLGEAVAGRYALARAHAIEEAEAAVTRKRAETGVRSGGRACSDDSWVWNFDITKHTPLCGSADPMHRCEAQIR